MQMQMATFSLLIIVKNVIVAVVFLSINYNHGHKIKKDLKILV